MSLAQPDPAEHEAVPTPATWAPFLGLPSARARWPALVSKLSGAFQTELSRTSPLLESRDDARRATPRPPVGRLAGSEERGIDARSSRGEDHVRLAQEAGSRCDADRTHPRGPLATSRGRTCLPKVRGDVRAQVARSCDPSAFCSQSSTDNTYPLPSAPDDSVRATRPKKTSDRSGRVSTFAATSSSTTTPPASTYAQSATDKTA